MQGADDFLDEALTFFADEVLYEDFNFEAPFRGRESVRAFLTEFDIPGLKFIPRDISDGVCL